MYAQCKNNYYKKSALGAQNVYTAKYRVKKIGYIHTPTWNADETEDASDTTTGYRVKDKHKKTDAMSRKIFLLLQVYINAKINECSNLKE